MPLIGYVLMISPVGLVIYDQLALVLPPQLGGLRPATGRALVAARMVI